MNIPSDLLKEATEIVHRRTLACEAVLLFHSNVWDDTAKQRWAIISRELLGAASMSDNRHNNRSGYEATTRVLCDMVRAALEEQQ